MEIHWPKVKIPEGFIDAESYLRHLVYQGARERFMDNDNDSNANIYREERVGFIEHELEALKGYEPYLIMLYDLMNFCRTENIMVSPGYGDAINSIVNYCLGITTTEPDSFFVFESFFLRGTDRYPKITIQVDKTRKDEILEYLKSTYGEHHVLRAGVGHRKGQRVPVYAVHACGVCIFDRPYHDITETVDIVEKESGKITTVPKLTMEELESLGYININILGKNCLTLTSQTLQLIKQNKGEVVDFDHIPDDDPATMEFIASGNEDIGKIWGGKGIAKDLASVKPSYMLELCAINSLWTLNLYDNNDYYRYLVREDKCDDRFELFDELFFEMSRGLILYQEQILCILYIMSGLNMAECERIRRQMSTTDYLSAKKTFLDGVKLSGGYDVKEAEQIWDYFMEIHKNTVSMAHYLSLTVLWYRVSWLRVHFQKSFLSVIKKYVLTQLGSANSIDDLTHTISGER